MKCSTIKISILLSLWDRLHVVFVCVFFPFFFSLSLWAVKMFVEIKRRNPKQKKWWNREKTSQCFIKINSVTTECIWYYPLSLFFYHSLFFFILHTNIIGFPLPFFLSFSRSFGYESHNWIWMRIQCVFLLPRVHGILTIDEIYIRHIRQHKR